MLFPSLILFFFFFNDTATTEIYTLSLHDALPIWDREAEGPVPACVGRTDRDVGGRSEEHTSELQSRLHLVCRLLLEKKKKNNASSITTITINRANASQRRLDVAQPIK